MRTQSETVSPGRYSWEAFVSWQFIKRDLSTTLIPSAIFMTVALSIDPRLRLLEGIGACLFGAVYCYLYVYSFCLANQLGGIEEDRVNKPDRPLPSGLVSERGTRARWLVVSALFLGVGLALDVADWAALWVVVTVLHNFGGLAKRWWTKNVVAMSLGTLASLSAVWEISAPTVPLPWGWMAAVSAWVGLTASTQDFRDVKGDALIGRRTLPIVLGGARARGCMAVVWVAMAGLIHVSVFAGREWTAAIVVVDAVSVVLHGTIAYRLLAYRTPRQDHTTYLVYTALFCLILLSGLVAPHRLGG